MTAPNGIPNRLRLRDGVLTLEDGSDPREYLRSVWRDDPIQEDEPMVLVPRSTYVRLVQHWYLLAAA